MKVMKQGGIKMISLLLTAAMLLSVFAGIPVSAYDLTDSAPVSEARSVTYLDEYGDEQTVQAIPLESGMTALNDGWYYIDGEVTLIDDVILSGAVKLILLDGASLNMDRYNLGNQDMIYGTVLTVYRAPGENEGVINLWRVYAETMNLIGGQIHAEFRIDADDINVKGGSLTAETISVQDELNLTGGSVDLYDNIGWIIYCYGDMKISGGTLHAKADNGIAVLLDGDITVSGGTVDIEGDISGDGLATNIVISGGSVTTSGEFSGKNFTISGGTVNADKIHCHYAFVSGGKVDVAGEFYAYNDIKLGWTKLKDSIKAGSYGGFENLYISNGQQLTDGTDVYSGSYTYDDRDRFAGKTLVPYYSLSAWKELQFIIDHSDNGDTVSLRTDTTAESDDTHLIIPSGKEITLDLNGYTLDRNMLITLGDGNVITNNGTLTITDTSAAQTGKITGGLTGNNGGGIQNNSVLTLEGGTITGNRAYSGGGIANGDNRNKSAVFIMNGGSVTGNTALNSGGGGIYNYGRMTMNGGSVTDNTVNKADYSGGGIFSFTSLTLKGGSVTGNTAGSSGRGGGIYYYGGTLDISGSPVVTGNTASEDDNDLDIDGNRTVTVSGSLSGNARIGIHRSDFVLDTAFTSGLSGRGEAANFISNHDGYAVRLDDDGEAIMKLLYSVNPIAPEHGTVTADVSYACEGDTVTLTVTPADDYAVKSVTVNGSPLNAQNGVYSFTMPAENVAVTAVFEKAVYTITYDVEHGTVTGPTGAYSGDTVTLSPAADDGYRLETLTVTDANGDPVSLDSDYRFTMPSRNVTVTAVFRAVQTVTYLDENGDEQTAQAFVLNSGDTSLNDTWYCVDGNVTISRDVDLFGDVKLILCDGASLSMGTHDIGNDTMNGSSLTVYRAPGENEGSLDLWCIRAGTVNLVGGQFDMRFNIEANVLNMKGGSLTAERLDIKNELNISGGSVDLNNNIGWIIYCYGDINITGGTLHAKSDDGSVITCNGDITVAGGTVDLEGRISSTDDDTTIAITGGTLTTTGDITAENVIISGGNVDVGGKLYSYEDITLGWTDLTDSIKANTYGGAKHIIITPGQKLTDGETVFSGSYDSTADRDLFAGKTLVPHYSAWYELQYMIDHAQNGDTITMHTNATAAADETALVVPAGKNLTLDLSGYMIDRNLTSQQADGNAITNNGTLTITDSSDPQSGMITGGFNTVEGGAVKNNGTLTINGGTFTENTAKEGGAIANNTGARLTINGGSFFDNTTHTWGGGGILNMGTMTMNGGSISGNTVSAGSMNGGGIWTNNSLTINGGYVTGNTAGSGGNGGGIYYNGGTLNLSGAPGIFGNTASGNANDLHFNGNYTVTISDDLSADANIGIRRKNEDLSRAFTSGLSGRGDASSFFSNHSEEDVRLDNNGEAILKHLYTITADTAEHGSVEADQSSACEGDPVTLTVTPDEGYSVKSVSVNGSVIEAQDGTYSFTMPAASVTVTAEFEMIAYTITYEETAHGSVTGPQTAGYGETVTLTVTPDTDYQLKTLTVYDKSHIPQLVDANHSFTMPAGNVTVTAEFVERTPYAVYDSTVDTLTFRYDFEMPGENAWALPLTTQTPPWQNADISKAVFDPSFSDYQPTSTAYWFYGVSDLAAIEGIGNLDTSAVTDMSYMFAQCGSLTSLDLTGLDTSAVTDMTGMFYNDSDLQTITVGAGWNTDSVTASSDMFRSCTSLTGGSGTTYDSDHTDAAYAHIDGGTEDPGYLTGKEYTITWLNEDGTLIDKTQVIAGEIPTHADPVKRPDDQYCYTFSGWMPQPIAATADTTYTATFSKREKNYRYDRSTKELTLLFGEFSASLKWGDDVPASEVESVTANSGVRFVGDCSHLFEGFIDCSSIDLSNVDTSGMTDMSYMFSYCLSLDQLDLTGFDTAQVTNMSDVFNTCRVLTTLDLSDFDTSAVTNTNGMFSTCSDLETITVGAGWNMDTVVTSMAMFNNCSAIVGGKGTTFNMVFVDKAYAHPDGGTENPGYLTGREYTITWKDYDGTLIDTAQVPCGDIPTHTDPTRENDDTYIYTFAGWDPAPVPVAGDAVYTATYSRVLKNYRYDTDTKELTLLWGDFSGASKWGREVDAAQVKSVTANSGVCFVGDCGELFLGFTACESIDLSHVDTSTMTSTALMFKNCTSLTSLDLTDVDTSSVTDMRNMFESCEALSSLDLSGFNTAQVENMSRMFDSCNALTSLDLSSFDTSSVTDMSRMFGSCGELTTITAGDSWMTDSVTASEDMFTLCSKLSGGNGTVYQPQYSNDKAYARIDGGPDAPGYFTSADEVYTVTWKNDNGDVLKTDYNQKAGTTPVYTGETPVKADEGIYSYTFSDWSPKIRPVSGDAVYTATYTTSAQVSYVDENGETKSVKATVITGDQTVLDGGWYAVTENVTFNERLTFSENANLILCDEAALTLHYQSSDPLSVLAKGLNVYGQENGSGKITLTADDDDGQFIYLDALALYGGQIESVSRKDILLTNGELAVYGGRVKDVALMSFDRIAVNGGSISVDTTFDFAIASASGIAVNSGNVYAKGNQNGMYVSAGSIDLSWTETTDSICANSYYGNVELKKKFIDEMTNEYEPGEVEDISAIGGVTLYAIHDHSYEGPVWTWTADNSSATAKFTCSICGHEETETADAVCELLDHQCTQPGHNHYSVSITFDSQEYTDEKTVYVEATEHSYDSGRTLLKVYCMRDGLVRYTCTACGVIKDETVKCRGYHNWTEREISYEEYQEEIEPQHAHSHSDLDATGSPEDLHFTMKECSDCNTKLVKGPDGNWYERFDRDSYEDDLSTCASEADAEELIGKMADMMAAESSALGASAATLSTEALGETAVGLLGLLGSLFTAAGILFSKSRNSENECVHEKVRLQTKAPTCTESGSYEVICYKCGRLFDTGDVDALGHNWGSWTLESVDEITLLATETRSCTRCQQEEKRKQRIAVADLLIQYTDDGTNYIDDPYSTDGTGSHCECSVTFTDYASWISCTPTHAVDYENPSDYFTFTAIEKNGYEFVGWYMSDGTEITKQALASRPKVGKNVYYARFKKRTLDIEYKLYNDSDKSGGSHKSGKLKIEVGGKTYEKTFAEDQSSCTISIDHEHLTGDSVFRITLTMDPNDKCAFIKDIRTDYKGSEARGQKNRKISRDDDDDIHVMKKTEHSYSLSISELLDDGKLNVTKVQYATDLEKGIKIAVDKTDTNKFPGCSTKIRYKLNGQDQWRSAADGITMIYHSGDKFAISAEKGDGKEFDGWRENLKIITTEQDYSSTVYADATYTPIFRYTTIRANYVDIFGNFIAAKDIGEEPPTPYSYANYEFTGWDKEPTEIIENGEIITAQYRKLQHKVTVTADGCTITGTVDGSEKTATGTLAVDYDSYVTVTKADTAYWTVDDKIVCYGDTYTFLAEVDITLVPHKTTPGEEQPLVEIISVKKISETDYRLEFIATRYIPENCQFIQAGFVCGKNMTEEDLNLDNVGKQGSNPDSGTVKVGYCESTENNAEFSMTYGIKDQNAPAMAKAFISYIDANGDVQILYSGMVTFNYQ